MQTGLFPDGSGPFFNVPAMGEVDLSVYTGTSAETPADPDRWVYTATLAIPTSTTVRITVTASDRPGGLGTSEEERAL